MNVFARESHIDVMAAAAGVDPVEFRLRNIERRADARACCRRPRRRSAGSRRPAPAGAARASPAASTAGTTPSLVAEVKVDPRAERCKVERVVCAQDMGVVVNPDGATMQVEGCITMGLGYVLAEEVRFEGGQILDENFDTYELPRFSWLPKIETVLVKNDALAPQGGRRAGHRPDGRGDRERRLRRDRRADAPAADDAGARAGGAGPGQRRSEQGSDRLIRARP